MSGARTKRAKRLAKIFPIVADLVGQGEQFDQVWWARHDSREAWHELSTPISKNARGDEALTESNFRVAERLIDAASPWGTKYRWDAWPGGQIQTLVIRADDAAALKVMTDIVNCLSEYSVLDDEDFSELQWEQDHPSNTECYSEDDCCTKCQECDNVIPDDAVDMVNEAHSYNCSLNPENAEESSHEDRSCHTGDIECRKRDTKCGSCERDWCDRCNPTHGPRCPFELEHDDE